MKKENAKKEEEKQKDEEVDIDLDDPEVDAAALKIQSSFKGKKARAEVAEMKKVKTEGQGYKEPAAMKEVMETKEEERDIKEKELAVVKIQSGYRGTRDRERVKKIREEKKAVEGVIQEASTEVEREVRGEVKVKMMEEETGVKMEKKDEKDAGEKVYKEEWEEDDINWEDPVMEEMATRVQAGYA